MNTLQRVLARLVEAGDVIEFKRSKKSSFKDVLNDKMAKKFEIREKDTVPLKIRLRNLRQLIEEVNEGPDGVYEQSYLDALEYEKSRLLDEYYVAQEG